MKKTIRVFLDAGLQKTFIPLRRPVTYTEPPKGQKLPDSLIKALTEIDKYDPLIPNTTKTYLDELFNGGAKRDWKCFVPYLRARFGQKTWHLKNGNQISLNGIWIMIETNTSGQDENLHITKYDRGYFYQSNGLTQTEKDSLIDADKNNMPRPGGTSHYIPLHHSECLPFTISVGDQKIDFGELSFEIGIIQPNGEMRDVDVILDLGNTRSAGLLFDHNGNATFSPDDFKKLFKVLRIKPDPASGEYDSLDDVEAGIAQSWIVLHELDHQTYLDKDMPKEPALLQTELHGIDVQKETKGWIFKKNEYRVSGCVIQRIPQMFTQLSPVLLGDQAEREFNLPYARTMISVGAKLQQSSPKRYYWDDSMGNVWWNMLLNEWDKSYDEHPDDATRLPTLQGEMLRFIQHNGNILDLSKDRQPVDQPSPFPTKPAYPKQSTLTWFLLHILERAYAQSNSVFSQGADFIPHRLRKVLITYPSGWTNDEVTRYRERCQEALDIFSQTNIYHGIKSEFRLQMIPWEQTPDEAVAGQLPFVFSEIIRYPGQTAGKWISLVGKKRSGTDTVRIMNFDIGGGTSDISVVEYKDQNDTNSGIAQNILSTSLLFKDGQTIAGDDLIKKIIEKIILGGLIHKTAISGLKEKIIAKFTKTFTNIQDDAIRCRIIRTCLIPLASHCLANLSSENLQFSAQEAGINQNNWNEFIEFIGFSAKDSPVPFAQKRFSFNANEINALIEIMFAQLFRNCAMYAAAYDIDMLIFSGKPSELPYIRTMARKFIPIDDGRIIFAREFKAGHWYPFTDDKGYIQDAKTVTVVGSALYYALSNGLISGWKISTSRNISERNEWGQLESMKGAGRKVFMNKTQEETTITILPNTIIARRQNICSSPEPVYKFSRKSGSPTNNPFSVSLKRNKTEDGESLSIISVNGSESDAEAFELKLWPCESGDGISFWQEKGIFSDLDDEE